LRRRAVAALHLVFLLMFLAASTGTHEVAATPRHDAGATMHGAHHAKHETPPCPHRDGSDTATGCCLAGPCKLALFWRDPPPPFRPLPVLRVLLSAPVPAEALPEAPWRPPA